MNGFFLSNENWLRLCFTSTSQYLNTVGLIWNNHWIIKKVQCFIIQPVLYFVTGLFLFFSGDGNNFSFHSSLSSLFPHRCHGFGHGATALLSCRRNRVEIACTTLSTSKEQWGMRKSLSSSHTCTQFQTVAFIRLHRAEPPDFSLSVCWPLQTKRTGCAVNWTVPVWNPKLRSRGTRTPGRSPKTRSKWWRNWERGSLEKSGWVSEEKAWVNL